MDGRPQLVAHDLDLGRSWTLTDAPTGIDAAEIEPDGRFVWWYETDPRGGGQWLRQPFPGGPATPAPVAPAPATPALTGVPSGRRYGIAFDASGQHVAVGVGIRGESRVYLGRPGTSGQLIATIAGYATVVDLSPDGGLLALAGRPDGPAAVLLMPTGPHATATAGADPTGPVALAGSHTDRLWPLEFRPDAADDPELLVVVEHGGRYTVATWRASAGMCRYPGLSFDTEITAQWYEAGPTGPQRTGGGAGTGAGRTVLIQHDRAGHSRLLLADLDADRLEPVPTPTGTILDVSGSPDGRLHLVWSREATPPRMVVVDPRSGRTVMPDGEVPPALGRRTELWTHRPYGPIHSFLATPPGDGPWPTLFLLHGGPYSHDRDVFDPRVELCVRAGYAVVRTNYRGSTGYGPAWRYDFDYRVGPAQLEDLDAVRAHLVELGVAEPHRIGLCGYSWGGYLALLAMGAQPGCWAVGIAVSPIADYVSAYRATTPALREVDDELFGGTPDTVPERYRVADPMTYVHQVRGPVLVAAAQDDDKCPPAQIERYVDALRSHGVPHRLLWIDGGHPGAATDHTAVFTAALDFAAAALAPVASRAEPLADPKAPAEPKRRQTRNASRSETPADPMHRPHPGDRERVDTLAPGGPA